MVSDPVNSNSQKKTKRSLIRILLIAGAVALASWISSCASPAYYWQAASGHFALMHARQPVQEAIEQQTTDEDTAEKLKLSVEIRNFAVEKLGLPDNGSYTQFVNTGRDAVVWNVVAAPEFSLEAKEWCFPVSGCVPYRGYFEQEKAEQFAAKLEAQALDVNVSPAIAYSTLGWFKDPLLDTMWKQSDTRFAAYIFHELAHQQLYVKGDSRFNESYASFVEMAGVRQWLEARDEQQAIDTWMAMGEAEHDFNQLLQVTRDDLADIYNSGEQPNDLRTRKLEAFARMETSYRQIRDTRWNGTDYFGGWFSKPLNNARFALLDTYQGGNCAFGRLFEEAGENITRFHDLAREKSELPADERSAWLDQTCNEIAQAGQL